MSASVGSHQGRAWHRRWRPCWGHTAGHGRWMSWIRRMAAGDPSLWVARASSPNHPGGSRN